MRRAIVERLRVGDARVTELASGFDMSLAAASKQIRVLETAGMIERTVRGRDHYLSLRSEPLGAAGRWIDANRAYWEARLDALDDLVGGTGSR